MIQILELFPGITLRCISDQRFKHGCLSLQMIRPMCRQEAALNALLPAVLLPAVGNQDFYRITFVGEASPFDMASLSFPQFPNLELRDRTVPPTDLWGCIGADSLEGNYFRLLHDALTEDEAIATLAAKISRKILDGQEVVLP